MQVHVELVPLPLLRLLSASIRIADDALIVNDGPQDALIVYIDSDINDVVRSVRQHN